jgi:hypothetical protein
MTTTAFDLYRDTSKPINRPGQAFTCSLLPAFTQRLAVLADADWRAVIGARDLFTNLSPSRKQAVNRLCEISTPSTAELMAALADATHNR